MGKKLLLAVVIVLLFSFEVYACSDDSDCADDQKCSLGSCLNIEDCLQDADCEMIDGHVRIVDVSPSICDGELVDITIEGILPFKMVDFFEIFGHSIAYPNGWIHDCFMNYNIDLQPGWSWDIIHGGETVAIGIGIYDDDGVGYDEIDSGLMTADTKINMYDDVNEGNCISVAFKHTFNNIDLSSFADGVDGDVELYAAAAGASSEQLDGTDDIDEFGAGYDDGYYSPQYNIDIDDDPPPTTDPEADPNTWTTVTTPNILGYAVVDSGSGVDHYEYQIDSTGGSWTGVGEETSFNTPSQSDGTHTVYVRAVDRCNPGDPGSVNVYINSQMNCECGGGECCSDGCNYDAAGSWCNEVELSQYDCLDGHGLGSDVYVRERYQKCTGSSAACSGTSYYDWGIKNECGPDEYCASDGDSSCTSCSTTCDDSCQSLKCHGIDPDCTSGGGSSQCSDQGGSCSGGNCVGVSCIYNPADACVDSSGCLRPGTFAWWMCDQNIQVEYACKEGNMAGDDVWEKAKNRFCSGTSPNCDGPLEWSWSQIEDCGANERCANDGDTTCTPTPAETCNGADDDYDGDVDEGLSGNLCPLQDGVCSGAREKCIGGSWQSCSSSTYGGDYQAAETRCDGLDNDCDGSVDGSLSRSCGVTWTGACTMGTESCSGGAWTGCTAVLPTTEVCDGSDSDCDGIKDGSEGFGTMDCYDAANSSYAGTGVCSYGYYECTDSGWGSDCVGDVGPEPENCVDGLDNDCDGYTDADDDDCRCDFDSDCGTDGDFIESYCSGNDLLDIYRNYSCINPGANNSCCNYTDYDVVQETCGNGCEYGRCIESGYLWVADYLNDKIHKTSKPGMILESIDISGVYLYGLTWDGEYFWYSDDATNKIYKLSKNGTVIFSFASPGPKPSGLAWDGEYLWHTDYGMDRVYKLTVDGEVVDSFSVPYAYAYGIEWDGNNLWISDYEGNINKLTTNGTVLDSIGVPTGVFGVAWDGEYLWCTSPSRGKMYKVSTGGTILDSYNDTGGRLFDLAWDGKYLWALDYDWDAIHKLEKDRIVVSFDSPGGNPRGLTWDGQHIWNVDSSSDRLYQITTKGDVISNCNIFGGEPVGLTWDGNNFWYSATDTGGMYKIDSSCNILNSFGNPGGPDASGLTWDGSYLWSANSGNDKIFKSTTGGSVVDSINSPNSSPAGLTFDGVYFWNSDGNGQIYRLLTDGTVLENFTGPSTFIFGLAWQPTDEVIECYSESECGTDEYVGENYCIGNDVYRDYGDYSCSDAATHNSSCDYTSTPQLNESCGSGEICYNGGCVAVNCTSDLECGQDVWIGNGYCSNGDVYQVLGNHSCENVGTVNASCGYNEYIAVKLECGSGCSNGKCEGEGYMWHSDSGTDKIYKLAEDFTVVESFGAPGGAPYDLTYDGEYLWLIESDSDRVYKITTEGIITDYFNSPGIAPFGLEWDGSNLWLAESSNDMIYKMTTNGSIVSNFSSPGPWPKGLAWDGSYLWHADNYINTEMIYKLDTSGNVIDSFSSPSDSPRGLEWDGEYLWNADSYSDKIYKLTTSGAVVDSFDSIGAVPNGLAWSEDIKIVCVADSDCGTDKYIGDKYCNGNNVVQLYRTYDCVNPGTVNSSCSHGDAEIIRDTCSGSCVSGTCDDIACYSDDDCGDDRYVGSKYCQSGDVWQDYREYDCVNPKTVSAACSSSDQAKRRKDCEFGCQSGICLDEPSGYACSSNAGCGTDGYVGSQYCNDGNEWQDWRTWTCNNAGTIDAYCSYDDNPQFKTGCAGGCLDGWCVGAVCNINSDCGTDEYIGTPYCDGNDVYQVYRVWSCDVPGTDSCSYTDGIQFKEGCAINCLNGVCVDDDGRGSGDADLEVSYFLLQYPDNPVAGDSVTLTFHIHNVGNTTVDEAEWRLDSGAGYSIGGVVSDLKEGEGMGVGKKITYSSAGTYYAKVKVDPNNKIEEFNEGNNEKELIVVVS
ncbi:hypothetical protein KY332_01675 [Candidatus Woesearchaeota archaeon]|nr:hypothetical protein [Candidatus Woesearchaeota archaeon]